MALTELTTVIWQNGLPKRSTLKSDTLHYLGDTIIQQQQQLPAAPSWTNNYYGGS